MRDPVENSLEFSMSMFRNRDDMYAAMREEIGRLRKQLAFEEMMVANSAKVNSLLIGEGRKEAFKEAVEIAESLIKWDQKSSKVQKVAAQAALTVAAAIRKHAGMVE